MNLVEWYINKDFVLYSQNISIISKLEFKERITIKILSTGEIIEGDYMRTIRNGKKVKVGISDNNFRKENINMIKLLSNDFQ